MTRQTSVDPEKLDLPSPLDENQDLNPPNSEGEPHTEPATKSRSRWAWWLLAIAAALGVLTWNQRQSHKNAGAVEAKSPASAGKNKGDGNASIVAARAQKGNIDVFFTALGAVTPIYTVTLKSRVDGQLMNVMFQEGQMVKEGDLLVEIDTRPYQAALDLAVGQLARDQALLKNALIDLDRYKSLVTLQAVPEQQLATQDALVQQYKGIIGADQAAVELAKVNLVYCHITSPINGLIGLRLVDPGNIVHATDTNGLLVITQMDPISVIFTLAEDQLPPVFEKMRGGKQLPVQAWDRELKNKLADGTLQTIDNQIDPTTGTLKLRANFNNPNRQLFPSQFVNVRLMVDQKYGVTLVPSSAIQRNSQTAYAWLVKADHTVTVRPVVTGVVEGEQTQIVGGVEPGDTVVTVGVDRLQEGSKVSAEISDKSVSK